MNVNFEFPDNEAIENVITCLNYPFDKVIFSGMRRSFGKEKSLETTFYAGSKAFFIIQLSNCRGTKLAHKSEIFALSNSKGVWENNI